MKNLLLGLSLFLFHFSLLGQQVTIDKVYEENIQSVRLFPQSTEFSSQLNSPIISLQSDAKLQLTFDDLAYDPDLYSVKIIHCNADWTPSTLKENEYLNQFNEFNILDYAYSINTRIPYIHYNFALPQVSKTGNYIIKVYRGRDESQVILTRRFMVFQNQVLVAAQIVPPSQTQDRRSLQQINLNINYKNRDLLDPRNSIKVVIRQNQRWDNVKAELKPTMIREDINMMEYRLFDGTNIFLAGNEFRFIDLRYVRAKGVNVGQIKMEEDVVYAEALMEKPRSANAYSQYLDVNGQYAVFNFERQNHELESEYLLTTFNLQADGISETPYLIGALTQWGTNPNAKMQLNTSTGSYQTTLLLKQGWYDYQYAFMSPESWNTTPIEGSHFETENEYEVLIYYRDMGSRYDELIGYVQLNPNKRRL
jgi:hypothetical protein